MLFRKHFFSQAEASAIVKAISEAESLTSGEIRVHVEAKSGKDVIARANEVFKALKMQETALRNGVLIYLAFKDKKFAIIGDKGIDEVVPSDFWNSARDSMAAHFRKGSFVDGVLFGIKECAKHLSVYFPAKDGDKNELSNEISEG